jgi:hypothetical protein
LQFRNRIPLDKCSSFNRLHVLDLVNKSHSQTSQDLDSFYEISILGVVYRILLLDDSLSMVGELINMSVQMIDSICESFVLVLKYHYFLTQFRRSL